MKPELESANSSCIKPFYVLLDTAGVKYILLRKSVLGV